MTSQHRSGRLTTHVLDTTNGRPAVRLRIVLSRLDAQGATVVIGTQTNLDGRCDAPLLSGDTMVPGRYELVFHAGAYLQREHGTLPEPPFLDEIPIRFGIADADAHYHVPLLISPYGYSTYRGS
ncbi:hydroxyisourate hydrolase [Bradyrhizobium sp. 2TAF24]|uniref:hydroxyisourate hydrolase n=1 Tax=Bradyrhizobium sp. 2TAF24 TaxID=3233011 RepID=UPI003F934CB9